MAAANRIIDNFSCRMAVHYSRWLCCIASGSNYSISEHSTESAKNIFFVVLEHGLVFSGLLVCSRKAPVNFTLLQNKRISSGRQTGQTISDLVRRRSPLEQWQLSQCFTPDRRRWTVPSRVPACANAEKRNVMIIDLKNGPTVIHLSETNLSKITCK